MFDIRQNLNRRSNRYNIYQPQRYALYLVGKWMGLIGSASLLFSLTIKWYFLLDDNTTSVQNIFAWSFIIGSVLLFLTGALFIILSQLNIIYRIEQADSSNTQTAT